MKLDRENEMVARVPLLNGSNYPQWKFRMQVLLEEHDLKECIELEADNEVLDETTEDVTNVTVSKKAKWKAIDKKNRKCKSLLISKISDDLLEYVQDQTSPREIWTALESVFERKSIASRLHLQKKMLRYTGGALREHFLTFERLMREYKSTGVNLEDVDIVCYLLVTLGTKYSAVVTAIETMPTEKLTMEFVKCRLLDEEIKQSSGECESRVSKMDEAALSGMSVQKPKKNNKKKQIQWKCYCCHREGHKIADCPERDKTRRVCNENSAHVANNNVCFLASDTAKFQETSWIVDSGSSEHMSNDRSLFNRLVPMKQPMYISVAKEDETIVANECGDVDLFVSSERGC